MPRERRLLCGSIVDYFVSKKIKFNTDIMDYVAEQIVEHFPTEDKVFFSRKERLEGFYFIKNLLSFSFRNPGLILVVTERVVVFSGVIIPHAKGKLKKLINPLQNLLPTLTKTANAFNLG